MRSKLLRLIKGLWQNRSRKLLALLLAFVSWYAIRGAISFENVITGVPLNIRLAPEWAVLDRSTDVVDIVFQGSRDDLFRLGRGNVDLVLDLRGKEYTGSTTVRLNASMVVAPGSARAIKIQPPEVTIKLDQQATRQLPVKIDLQGALPEGFEIESTLADPATVQVSGPRQMIETLIAVRSAPVSLEGRRQSFRERLELIQPGEMWQARLEPQRINARVTIRERSETRSFQRLVVQALVNPLFGSSAISILPVSVDVVVKGTTERLEQLSSAAILPYVDCRELTPGGRFELPILVNTPAGIVLESTTPASAIVTLHGQ